jgi:hypothetical protein
MICETYPYDPTVDRLLLSAFEQQFPEDQRHHVFSSESFASVRGLWILSFIFTIGARPSERCEEVFLQTIAKTNGTDAERWLVKKVSKYEDIRNKRRFEESAKEE